MRHLSVRTFLFYVIVCICGSMYVPTHAQDASSDVRMPSLAFLQDVEQVCAQRYNLLLKEYRLLLGYYQTWIEKRNKEVSSQKNDNDMQALYEIFSHISKMRQYQIDQQESECYTQGAHVERVLAIIHAYITAEPHSQTEALAKMCQQSDKNASSRAYHADLVTAIERVQNLCKKKKNTSVSHICNQSFTGMRKLCLQSPLLRHWQKETTCDLSLEIDIDTPPLPSTRDMGAYRIDTLIQYCAYLSKQLIMSLGAAFYTDLEKCTYLKEYLVSYQYMCSCLEKLSDLSPHVKQETWSKARQDATLACCEHEQQYGEEILAPRTYNQDSNALSQGMSHYRRILQQKPLEKTYEHPVSDEAQDSLLNYLHALQHEVRNASHAYDIFHRGYTRSIGYVYPASTASYGMIACRIVARKPIHQKERCQLHNMKTSLYWLQRYLTNALVATQSQQVDCETLDRLKQLSRLYLSYAKAYEQIKRGVHITRNHLLPVAKRLDNYVAQHILKREKPHPRLSHDISDRTTAYEKVRELTHNAHLHIS